MSTGMEVMARAVNKLLLKDHWICELEGDSVFVSGFKITVTYVGDERNLTSQSSGQDEGWLCSHCGRDLRSPNCPNCGVACR